MIYVWWITRTIMTWRGQWGRRMITQDREPEFLAPKRSVQHFPSSAPQSAKSTVANAKSYHLRTKTPGHRSITSLGMGSNVRDPKSSYN